MRKIQDITFWYTLAPACTYPHTHIHKRKKADFSQKLEAINKVITIL